MVVFLLPGSLSPLIRQLMELTSFPTDLSKLNFSHSNSLSTSNCCFNLKVMILPRLNPILTPARSSCLKPRTSSKIVFLASVGVIVPLNSLLSIEIISITISSRYGPSGLGVLNTGGRAGESLLLTALDFLDVEGAPAAI